ncbi:nicotinamide-nucleotide amidase [Parabacteroides sp. PFB2-10]|uniref:CinA family protein n=1 Tax=Parabacteroides sp. PFB2-10 TaxID=1742405 RepID=UPI002473C420|nr:CinA family protein [Parabacteroides sp. PFB2-10]MDH6313133.1 nicotinamide-nucleotide amidase [Parabacteroides sp. PFB2-10]
MEYTSHDTPDSLCQALGEQLLSKRWMMGTAESCTGGRIAAAMTSLSGSSAYFAGGIISYSNEVKKRLLGVSEESLAQYGAVSRDVVEQMARGAIEALGVDCAVATSGIAGPTGGTPDKPVGTVWIAAALKDQTHSACFHFQGDRHQVMSQATAEALRLLLSLLLD